MKRKDTNAISVGGGKGGIGKSCFAANMGIALSRQGKRVILVDTDIEAPNLHTFVGINYPQRTLDDFLNSSVPDLEDIVLPTPVPGLHLISSAGTNLTLSDLNYQQRQRFSRSARHLDCDVIIFDVAAGTRMRVIDYFSLAPVMVIMLEPLPTALENAYQFLKSLLYRQLLRIFFTDKPAHSLIISSLGARKSRTDQSLEALLAALDLRSPEKTKLFRSTVASFDHIYAVVNKVRSKEQQEVVDRFARVVKRYLMLNLRPGGYLPFEPDMDRSIIARTPYIVQHPESAYARAMENIVLKLPT